MSSARPHKVICTVFRTDTPHTNSKEVIVIGTFDQASLPLLLFLFHSCLESPLPFHTSTFSRHHVSVYIRPALSAPPTSQIALKRPPCLHPIVRQDGLSTACRHTPMKWNPLPWFVSALLLVVIQYRRHHSEKEVHARAAADLPRTDVLSALNASLTSSLLPSPCLSFTDGARQLLGFGLGPIQRVDVRFAVVHLGGCACPCTTGGRTLLGGTWPVLRLPSAGRAQPRRRRRGEDSVSRLVTDVSI
jgi:hypothetical protein